MSTPVPFFCRKGASMVNYLQSCACRGRRPRNLTLSSYYSRKELLTRLIQNRRSPIFLVAPHLSGRTTLAIEYAESIFSFKGVFWFDGKSPCLLRDIDNGSLAATLLEFPDEPGLIVIDDLPFVGESRLKKVAQLFNDLVDQGWELIVVMVPACDIFTTEVKDVYRIHASDFLLDNAEIDSLRSKNECLQKPAKNFTDIERIAGAFWQPNNDPISFLKTASNKESLPDDALLIYFILLVLGEGSFEDIGLFVKGKTAHILESALKEYPYLGLDFCQQRFSCHVFSVEDISAVFSTLLANLIEYSRFNGRGSLILRLADALLGKGSPERACSLVETMATPAQKCAWLDNRNDHLFKVGCFLAPHTLHESLRLSEGSCRYRLILAEGWRLYFLDQKKKAAAVASRVMRVGGIDDRYKLDAALLILRSQASAQLALKAYALLEATLSYSGNPLADCESIPMHKASSVDLLPRKILSLMELCLRDCPCDAEKMIEVIRKLDGGLNVMTCLLVRLLESFEEKKVGDTTSEKSKNVEVSLRFVDTCYRHLESLREQEGLGFLEADLLGAIARCEGSALVGKRSSSALDLHAWARIYEIDLCAQRNTLARQLEIQAVKREEYCRTHPDELRNHAPPTLTLPSPTPCLSVRLFGGLEVMIGDRVVDHRLFSRQKVKTLLALLVINQGKEISRDRVAGILWPESSRESARRNLYSIWSLLRKALQTSAGDCPYLIRTQFSYKLDSTHLTSDVFDFTMLCRRLLFGNPDVDEWTRAFTLVNDLYAGDFMPTETSNEVVMKARESYRAQLVDSFAMAALRLCEIGEYHMALWFSQVAVSHDPTREDAYSLLMRAQASLGQRTAALDTYFKCRKYLSEELGIDPCSNTNMLYQEIVSEGSKDTLPDMRENEVM